MGNPYAPPDPDAPPRPAPPAPPPTAPPHLPSDARQQDPAPPEARTPPEPPTPEVLGAATRRVLQFGIALLAVLVVSTMPFPWRSAALVPGVLAVVLGVRALVAVRRARVRAGLVFLLALGIGLSAMICLQELASVAMWDVETTYQECLDGAVTVDAPARCDAQRVQAIEDWANQFGASVP